MQLEQLATSAGAIANSSTPGKTAGTAARPQRISIGNIDKGNKALKAAIHGGPSILRSQYIMKMI